MKTEKTLTQGRRQELASASDTLNTHEAAAYLGLGVTTLAIWRCTKRYHIPYIKVGRLVRYRISDLDAWLDSRRIDV